MEQKSKNVVFYVIRYLRCYFMGNMLTDKRKIPKRGVTRDGKGNI